MEQTFNKDIEWEDCHFCGNAMQAVSEEPRENYFTDGDLVFCLGGCGHVGQISCDSETPCSVMFNDDPQFITKDNEP